MPKSIAVLEEAVAAVEEPSLASAEEPLWRQRRDQLRVWLAAQSLPALSGDEIQAHFSGMPLHYWALVTEENLVWGLETIHRFFRRIALENTPATAPIFDWRPLPGGDGIRVMLCTWDRRGLLAKAAACFSATHLNIQHADIFTRADHIVLDVFQVCHSHDRAPALPEKLAQMGFLLDGALSEPPRFASVWACSRHKFLAPPPRLIPRITFDNEAAPSSTVVRIEASDRVGLLYDLLQALADAGVNVTQANIATEGAIAQDMLHVTGADGDKLREPAGLDELHRALVAAITVSQ